jgi:hypothetical protein
MERLVTRVAVVIATTVLLLAAATTTLAAGVDPSSLTPPPPPDASCHGSGTQVICDTVLNLDSVNEPAFDLPCGTAYFTGTDYRDGTRFYDSDGLLTRRHVTGQVAGTISLSPTGAGPTLKLTGHLNWWAYWPVPGSAGDGIQTNHGVDIKIGGPGLGSAFHLSGNFQPDGTMVGRATAWTDAGFAAVCAAFEA